MLPPVSSSMAQQLLLAAEVEAQLLLVWMCLLLPQRRHMQTDVGSSQRLLHLLCRLLRGVVALDPLEGLPFR